MPFETPPGVPGPLPDPTAYTDSHTLRVEPSAIPHLRKVFSTALTKLDRQVELTISEIRIRPWAGDPVSEEAAQKFNYRSCDASDAALRALQGYQQQLKSAVDALQEVEDQYRLIEGDNTALWGKQAGC